MQEVCALSTYSLAFLLLFFFLSFFPLPLRKKAPSVFDAMNTVKVGHGGEAKKRRLGTLGSGTKDAELID